MGGAIGIALIGSSAFKSYSDLSVEAMYGSPSLDYEMSNSQYTVHFGSNKALSEVLSLVNMVNVHNLSLEKPTYGGRAVNGGKIIIEGENIIKYDGNIYSASGINAKTKGYYNIYACSYDPETGAITGIKIEYSPDRIED